MTGSGVIEAAMPGRWAAPPAPAIRTRSPRSAAEFGVLPEHVGGPVRGDDPHLVGDLELGQDLDRALHHPQIGVAAHDHADERCRAGHGPHASAAGLVALAPRGLSGVVVRDARQLTTAYPAAVRTRLTELLEIEHPVMLAGMGGVSYHRLVAAVSEAGGFGCLGAGTMGTAEMVDEIRRVQAATAKPFGVDLLTALPDQMLTNVEHLVAERVPVFVAALGVPREVIELCHANNVLVVNMCGKVRHAIAAVEAGCDLVVAQGTEAGGHTGTVATMPLVPQVVDAVGDRVPVVAAGGIFDGRGLAAALALGADGVWVGTRFIATPEARSVPGYKDTLLATHEDGTVVSRAFSGKTMRVVRNDVTQYYEEHPDELKPFPDQMTVSFGEGFMHLPFGDDAQGVDPEARVLPGRPGRRCRRRARSRRRAGDALRRRGRAGARADERHASGPEARSSSRSCSYITRTSSSNVTLGDHPSFSRALVGSPMSRSTSAGRMKRGSWRDVRAPSRRSRRSGTRRRGTRGSCGSRRWR